MSESHQGARLPAPLGTPSLPIVPAAGLVFQGGVLKKGARVEELVFPHPFEKVPLVLITPCWEGQFFPVTSIETVVQVDERSFTIVSDTFVDSNSPANYYVIWLAIAGVP